MTPGPDASPQVEADAPLLSAEHPDSEDRSLCQVVVVLPLSTEGDPAVEAAYLLFTLLCPLSMVALVAWWAWSVRRSSSGGSSGSAPVRSTADDAEIARMRAQLDQLQAGKR